MTYTWLGIVKWIDRMVGILFPNWSVCGLVDGWHGRTNAVFMGFNLAKWGSLSKFEQLLTIYGDSNGGEVEEDQCTSDWSMNCVNWHIEWVVLNILNIYFILFGWLLFSVQFDLVISFFHLIKLLLFTWWAFIINRMQSLTGHKLIVFIIRIMLWFEWIVGG